MLPPAYLALLGALVVLPASASAQTASTGWPFKPPTVEVAGRTLGLIESDGRLGFAQELGAQFRWRFFVLGPTGRLASKSGADDEFGGSLDGGFVVERPTFRANLQGRLGVARHVGVGREQSGPWDEYEPYPGVDATVTYGGVRASLLNTFMRSDKFKLWGGIAMAYERDLEHARVAEPEWHGRAGGGFTEVGGSRVSLGIEVTFAWSAPKRSAAAPRRAALRSTEVPAPASPATSPAVPMAAPAVRSDTDVLQGIGSSLAGCMVDTTTPVLLQIEISPAGRYVRTTARGVTDAQRACFDIALASTSFAATGETRQLARTLVPAPTVTPAP